jgi:hypothetical protein
MGLPPSNRRVLVSVPERYVAGADTRGRQEGRPYPWSQQVIHEIFGLVGGGGYRHEYVVNDKGMKISLHFFLQFHAML